MFTFELQPHRGIQHLPPVLAKKGGVFGKVGKTPKSMKGKR